MKKKLVLWACVFCALFSANIRAEETERQEYYSGEWSYVINDEDRADISGYSGEDGYLTIPNEISGYTVTGIADDAFEYNDEITYVEIPEGVERIGKFAFCGCSNLESVIIPESVTMIGDDAFSFCQYLSSLDLPDSVSVIEGNPFRGCSTMLYVSPDHPCFAIIDGVLFDKIGKRLISYTAGNTDYSVPEGIREIGPYAFSSCSYIESVSFPASLLVIDKSAFDSCESLTSISFQEGLEEIGINAFDYCSELADITIPDTVKKIGDYAFSGCGGLTSIQLPEGLESLGDSVFSYCENLSEIKIPDSVSGINGNSFDYCQAQLIVSPDNPELATIDGVLFSKKNKRLIFCPDIFETYTIPEGIVEIGNYAFSNCEKLTRIVFPETVEGIGDYAFSCCYQLDDIHLTENIKHIGVGAFSCSGLTQVTLPKSIDRIEDYTFSSCDSLSTIVLPENLKSIGAGAFLYCYNLGSIEIPDSVESIGDGAFDVGDDFEATVSRDSYAAQYCKDNNVRYTYQDANDWLNS